VADAPPPPTTPGPPSVAGLQAHADDRQRCWWCGTDPLYVDYHDREWGVPVHDEHRLFEKLCLEGFQAGLSWLTILRKRPAFRAAFADFDPAVVAGYGEAQIAGLLADASIVRHRGKIEATVTNARAYVTLRETGTSLDALVWSFAPTRRTRPSRPSDIPATTAEATALAKDLRARGFRYVGPTTCYAFMQAMGLVDDHLVGCEVNGA
jgi:DNA-3-methyladenine glycosylase I